MTADGDKSRMRVYLPSELRYLSDSIAGAGVSTSPYYDPSFSTHPQSALQQHPGPRPIMPELWHPSRFQLPLPSWFWRE